MPARMGGLSAGVGRSAVICVDALPRLPGGTACGVLVDPRAFLVVLAMSLESLILLCAAILIVAAACLCVWCYNAWQS